MKRWFQIQTHSTKVSLALLVLRVVVGLAFVLHGWPKIQDPTGWSGPNSTHPSALLALAAVAEFGGGLALLLGLVTPLAAFGIGCTMLEAARLHAMVWGHAFVALKPDEKSYELAAVYLCVSLLFLLAGPGGFSLDRFLFGQKSDGK